MLTLQQQHDTNEAAAWACLERGDKDGYRTHMRLAVSAAAKLARLAMAAK